MSYCSDCKYFVDEDVFNGYGRCVNSGRVTHRMGYCAMINPRGGARTAWVEPDNIPVEMNHPLFGFNDPLGKVAYDRKIHRKRGE